MRYSGLNLCDSANGPGIRVSLFVSGCTIGCSGCFNKQAQDFNYGHLFTLATKNQILHTLADEFVSGFSLLGGDPFEPEHEEVLVDLCKSITKPIWIWTGRLYEDVMNTELIKYANVLIDGPFIKELSVSDKYYGSSNQRVIRLKDAIYEKRN